MATTEDIVKQVISALQEQSRNTEALPQEGNAGSVGSFVALKKADNSMVQVPISVIETMIDEKIDEIPTTGGDVDLSGYVQNSVFNQALTNLNTIKPRFGVINPDGSVLSSNALRANIMLSDGCRLVVNDGYLIGRVVILENGEAVDVWSDKLNLAELTIESGTQLTWLLDIYKKDNTEFSAAELDTVIKSLTFDTIRWDKNSNLNDYQGNGEYYIQGTRTRTANDNMPILNEGDVEGTLKVIADSVSKTAVQILTLLNVGGGDGNIYTRTRQNGAWGQWEKLQTNIEVGVIDQQQMDALVDNGIYSGILSTTGETFVIICINNYAIAQQVGVHHISQLKYSLVVGTAEVKIEKRTRDAYGFWTEWQGIGGGDTSVVNQTATTATIAPNVLNIWGEVASLDITLADGNVDVVNEYMFQFTSGATATTLVLPADIKWLSAPNIQANKTYQVSIINNLGVIGEFSHE